MEQRKTLHDYSLLLIFVITLDIFSFFTTFITACIDGTFEAVIAQAAPEVAIAVKIALAVIVVFEIVLIAGQAVIGYKGLQSSKNPVKNKGFITAAKIFLILNVISALSFVVTFFDGQSGDLIGEVLAFSSTLIDVLIYAFFIKAANAVRRMALNNA